MALAQAAPLSGLAGIQAVDLAPWASARAVPVSGLWLVQWDLGADDDTLHAWVRALPPSQRARVPRIGQRSGRLRHAASHAALVRLVGEAQVDPLGGAGWRGTGWSLSHTRWCAVIATAEHRIGVDVEADVERPCWRAAARAARSFTGVDAMTWPAFLEAWTRAEALLKAGLTEQERPAVMTARIRPRDDCPEHVLTLAAAFAPLGHVRSTWGRSLHFGSGADATRWSGHP